MKKIIMLLLASALVAQAGYIKWQMTSTSAPGHYLGGDARVVNGTTVVYLILDSNLAAVQTAITNGTFLTSGLIYNNSQQILNGSGATASSPDIPVTANAGETVDIRLVIFSGGAGYNYAKGGEYIISGVRSAVAGENPGEAGSTSFAVGNAWASSPSFPGVDWTAYGDPVPEPAIGLLALAGVGLLIRRRRRA